jgi:hypothetical protein
MEPVQLVLRMGSEQWMKQLVLRVDLVKSLQLLMALRVKNVTLIRKRLVMEPVQLVLTMGGEKRQMRLALRVQLMKSLKVMVLCVNSVLKMKSGRVMEPVKSALIIQPEQSERQLAHLVLAMVFAKRELIVLSVRLIKSLKMMVLRVKNVPLIRRRMVMEPVNLVLRMGGEKRDRTLATLRNVKLMQFLQQKMVRRVKSVPLMRCRIMMEPVNLALAMRCD